MKRRALALVAGLLLLGLTPGPTFAGVSTNLDQVNDVSLSHSTMYTGDFAQTFQAGKSGRLSGVDLYLDVTERTVAVSVQNTDGSGLPNGVVLASRSLSLTDAHGWVHFSLYALPYVTSGTEYAIVFTPGRGVSVYGSTDTYPDGKARPTPTMPDGAL